MNGILSEGFATRYSAAASYEDERRIRRAATKFWDTMTRNYVGWIQPHEGQAVCTALSAAFEGSWCSRDVAIVLDMAPNTVDFQVKASVGYWLASEFDDVCNS